MAEPPKTISLPPKRASIFKIRPVGRKWAPHEDIYHFLLTRSWFALFGLVAAVFVAVNALFAGLYMLQPGCIANARPDSFEDLFYFSVQTMATIGYGNMSPATRFSHIVVTIEAVIGMLGVALVTGITFSKFARPTARVLFSEKVVITRRDGVPHLQVRMANFRHNQIIDATTRIVLLAQEKTREGETIRRQVDLPLVRDRTSVLILTFTAMHKIDENSPLYGEDTLKRLREGGATFIVSMNGCDETTGQTVHTVHTYAMDDVVENAQFADVLTTAEDGTRELDYRKFHQIVPLPVAHGERRRNDPRLPEGIGRSFYQ